MTTPEIESVKQSLKEQEAKLNEIVMELEEDLVERRSDLERIQNAIAALEQKPRKKRKTPSKPPASKADVESALMAAKDANPDSTDDQLRQAAEEKLVEQGFARSGLALRFKQVLAHLNDNAASNETASSHP